MLPPSSSSAQAQPAVQVLTNSSLFAAITAFMPGVPDLVLQFRRTEYATYCSQAASNAHDHMLARTQKTSWRQPNAPLVFRSGPLLWHIAVVLKRKRILEALDALSPTSRYRDNPHVQLANVLGYAVVHVRDIQFLTWVFTRFNEAQQRQISEQQFSDLASDSDECLGDNSCSVLAVAQWLNSNGFEFPANTMDAAATAGNLPLVRFLHEHSRNGCTQRAMDDAAGRGHLDVVQFLHAHRTEGCSELAKSRALQNGRLEVLRFLHEHRNEGCSEAAVILATINGHHDCVRFALDHGFAGIEPHILPNVIMHGCFEVVQHMYDCYATPW